MKPSDELSELIHSMSPSEKRYFKLQANTFKDDSHYVLLFDFIDKTSEASDVDIRVYLKQHGVTVALSRLKNYLHQLILKTLREYHLEHYPEFKIIEAFRDFKILKDRKLDRQALKSLNRAVKLAKEYERYAYLWEVNRHLAGDDMLEADPGKFERTQAMVFDVQQDALEKLMLINKSHQLEAEAIVIQKEHIKTSDPEKLRAIDRLISEAKELEKEDLPGYGRAHLYSLYNICYAQTDRYEEALKTNTLYIESLRKGAISYGSSDEEILFALTNQFYHLLYQGKEVEFKKLAGEVIEDAGQFLRGKSEYYKMALLFAAYSFEMSYYILHGNFKEAEKYIGPAQQILAEYPGIANAEFLFAWYYRLVVINFGLGQYDRALQAINAILDGKVLKYGADYGTYIKMLNIIVLCELGHTKMLPSVIKATEQYAKSKGNTSVVDKLLLEMLKKLTKCNNDNEERMLCKEYTQKIKAEVAADETARTPLVYFDFLTWMDGKANGLLFGQAMKQRVLSK